jgi:hypothetical protein
MFNKERKDYLKSVLNAEQVVQGYHDFKAGDDYTNSCKIARKLEAEMR